MGRADHHAKSVQGIALALAGAIVWKKDDGTEIEVMPAKSGGTGNVLWVTIGGQRFAFSHNDTAGTIEMRQGSTQGAVLHSFSDTTPVSQVAQIFRPL